MLTIVERKGPDEKRQVLPSAAFAVAGTFHDLGNLIQVASSAMNIIARDVEMPALERKSVLDRARNSLERPTNLTQDAIRLIRGDAPQPEIANVAVVLREVALMMRRKEESRLLLHVEIEPDLPPLRCSSLGLQCALLNLLLNARDASAGSGTVSIFGRALWRDATVIGVVLSVTDEGIGMAPDTVARALDPFFTTKSDGTGGIGLTMVERFVQEAGGSLEISSALGEGTSVSIVLPVN